MLSNDTISPQYFWLNEPSYRIEDNRLLITTKPDTDLWQRTHYGFRRDNAHALLTSVSQDFSLSVRTRFAPNKQYDQCGLLLRLDSENWVKASMEFESKSHSRLGSVVTNLGYSDWATVDIHESLESLWYRIQSRGRDFLLEFSQDGQDWKQLRICHLLSPQPELSVGIYACSPMDSSFEATFDHFQLADSWW